MDKIKKELQLFFDNKDKFAKFYDVRTLKTKECELSFEHYSVKENIERFLRPFSLSSNYKKKGVNFIEPDIKSDTLTIYVNGICSTVEMAIYQTTWLEKLLKTPITLAYNYTDGFILDIYECMQDRTYKDEGVTVASKNLKDYLKYNIDNYKKINIIGFSQGCLITGRALEGLSKMEGIKNLDKITYTTFANPINNLTLPKDIKIEHFINKDDPVANIGIIEHKKEINGKKYYQNKGGHLFLADYIIPLCLDYFDKNSNFRKTINEEERVILLKDLSKIYFKIHD
jgi:hypothetical protein